MPTGSTPIGRSEATMVSATARTVPSPPAATTMSAPSSSACRAWPLPGSSTVVSYQSGSREAVRPAVGADLQPEAARTVLGRVHDHREPRCGLHALRRRPVRVAAPHPCLLRPDPDGDDKSQHGDADRGNP